MRSRPDSRRFSASIGFGLTLSLTVPVHAVPRPVESTAPILPARKPEKVRVAVLDFDYSSPSEPRRLSFLTGGASGVSDILVDRFVESGRYTGRC